MTSWHHGVTYLSRHLMSYVITKWISIGQLIRNQEITFFKMVSLTFDLWLWTWPLNSAEILPKFFPKPNFITLDQTIQRRDSWLTDTQTHIETDQTDLIPSTADAGRKNSDTNLRKCLISNRLSVHVLSGYNIQFLKIVLQIKAQVKQVRWMHVPGIRMQFLKANSRTSLMLPATRSKSTFSRQKQVWIMHSQKEKLKLCMFSTYIEIFMFCT